MSPDDTARPPRLATWIAGLRLHADEREFAAGDLEEEFRDVICRRGPRAARRWYWRQALRSALSGGRHRAWPGFDPVVATQRSVRMLSGLAHDLRYARRSLTAAPAFTAAVLLTLALGIGATTAMFSVVRAVLLTPPPFAFPERLVTVLDGPDATTGTSVSYRALRSLRTFGVLDDVGGWFDWAPTFGGDGPAEQLTAVRASASLFTTLGLVPARGRMFSGDEERVEAERVVVVSHAFWQRRLASDPAVVGRRLTLSDQAFTVVGVLPDWFTRLRPRDRPVDAIAPLRLTDATAPPSLNFIRVVGRLRPEQTAAIAAERLTAAVRQAFPDARPAPSVHVAPMRQLQVADARAVVWLLFGAVGVVLLISCANLANLLLARAIGRGREIAVRLALGASRWRAARQLLVESLALALVGGVLGVGLAYAGVAAAADSLVIAQAGAYRLRVDPVVLAFAVGVSLLAGLLFGLAPTLRAWRARPVVASSADAARGQTGRTRLPGMLIAAEVGLTLVLLAGAGLLLRTFDNLLNVDKGFETAETLTFNLATSAAKYPTPDSERRFFEDVTAAIARLPGVTTVGLTNELPLGGGGVSGTLRIEGRTFEPGQGPRADKRIISPGFFDALGIPVRAGRSFTHGDSAAAPGVMVVSESFAARYFPDGSAVGQRVAFDWNMEGFQEVIGVVGDVRHDALGGAPQPTVYVSHLQRPNDYMTVAIRAKVPAATIAGAVRAAVATVDAGRPITAMRTMETVLDESVEGRRVALWLVGSFAALGLILAATGIYGVVSYTTGLRRREVGIRVALGAARGEVLRVVVGRSAAMIAAGLAAGAVACVLLGGVIRSQLFGVEPTDATTFAFAIATLIVVALAAAWLPARASLRVDPARVLRSE